MNDDRTLAAWILIAGSVGIGVWYWKLSPWEKLGRLGKQLLPPGSLSDSGGGGLVRGPVIPGSTPGYSVVPIPGTSGVSPGIGP